MPASTHPTDRPYPIVRHPASGTPTPVLVSVPHYGTQPLSDISRDDAEPWFETFAYGFADTFVGDVYGDLHEHGATVLATPVSRMFVDVNRRRDDFEHAGGEVRSRRGVVRTHTVRDAPIFARPLGLADVEERLRALYDPYYSTLDSLLAETRQAQGYADYPYPIPMSFIDNVPLDHRECRTLKRQRKNLQHGNRKSHSMDVPV